ncbi:MAG: AAA family ATP:ADP antiporter, partial [Myxococcota bacterium]
MIAAGVMIAQQTAAKATRDALFLTSFDIARLPLMLIVAASVSIVAGLVATRVLRQVGPTRVIPAAFGVSAALLMVWWGLSFVSAGAAAVLLYIHIAALGGVLISGFWSLVTERFDPRTARLQMGRVATGATLGGFIGGVSAERVAALLGAAVMLPLLAVLHAVCAARVRSLAAGAAEHIQPDEEPGEEPGAAGPSSFSVLVGSAHLRNLAFLLITITVMATLLDYALKDYVASEWADEPDKLLRFFALFYTGASLITFLIQSLGGKWVLQRFGLSGAAASLPAAVGILGTVALFIPGVVTLVIARGMEAALRSSLFRSGYELFYTPIPADEKRATKTIIDVGADRAGDILGSVVVLALLALVPASGTYFALLG